MSNQWLGSMVKDPQRQQALRMDGIIIIIIIIIVVVVVVVVVEKR
jgi:t-SNARE complex subunit (syntaxin)